MIAPGCGKKGPPSLPAKSVSVRVVDLKGKRVGNDILLKGKLTGLGEKGQESSAKGIRVYFAQFPLENSPCADCPINYQDFYDLGPVVIQEEGFSYRLMERPMGQTYFFRVNVIGPSGSLGPPSNQVQVK